MRLEYTFKPTFGVHPHCVAQLVWIAAHGVEVAPEYQWRRHAAWMYECADLELAVAVGDAHLTDGHLGGGLGQEGTAGRRIRLAREDHVRTDAVEEHRSTLTEGGNHGVKVDPWSLVAHTDSPV